MYAIANPIAGADLDGQATLFSVLGGLFVGLDLKGNQDRQTLYNARRIAANLCAIAARFAKRYNELYQQITKYTKFQAHHIFQNSVMEELFEGYDRALGFAIPLLGGGSGSPHAMATQYQRFNKGRTPRFVA
jgi:uncharacterized protein YozE (UPF0346 family)